ncbi:acetyltransferase (GNAT) family protein [Hoeflea marina]|uniref:Acetyltransferase (GNAT) family protein n=1 Tax=Hoeflea marina TaxID=274592 RepID=A0A317PF86_9HYPH|nr:N-acetyltransferase [Hoeflea marina]PWV97123.1 acetyltransferase (GNAT) family protein [Hoeflea marina]
MTEISIRPAVIEDAARLNAALRQLSLDMDDVHRASDADIVRFCFGPSPVMHALLAETDDGQVAGVAAYSPFFSTTLGAVGLYVSDLWVAESGRGRQFGVRLLSAVRAAGRRAWEAEFIRLNVYHTNPRALAFYERIGFVHNTETQFVTLRGAAYDRLGDAQ